MAFFVAIVRTYCHKLNPRCNMPVLLRQLWRVAGNNHFVAIESGYCNEAELCGDIRTHIATIMACGGSYGHCCNKWIPIATKYVLVVIGRLLPQIYLALRNRILSKYTITMKTSPCCSSFLLQTFCPLQ